VLHLTLESRLRAAVAVILPEAAPAQLSVRPATDAKFGDYQSNALMALAKERKLNPRQLATDVVAKLDVADLCEPVEIAGPGFLNFRLKPAALADVLAAAVRGEHLFFAKAAAPRTVIIDFSSPNVAKPMHVGHIRSTILGDSLARTLRLLGHRVITDNHIGDWGTQFGMLLIGWKTLLERPALEADPIAELERVYKAVNAACKETPATLEAARAELVKLQAGDAENLAIWHEMIRLSQVQFNTIYGRLGVKFDHTLGESFYNPWLKDVVTGLVACGLARESEGAIAVFSDGTLPLEKDPLRVRNKDGECVDDPLLIQKSDGASNYATTDLATLDHRLREWHADEIIYVVGSPQQPHFNKLFNVFRRWQPEAAGKVKLMHAWFGSILGDDGKPFKTRSGDTVKLAELLNEAEERALKVVVEKRPDLDPSAQREIARKVGLGAVKYQDLLSNRQSDYVFSWDKALALTGNTAVYVQYQFTRANKVVRYSGVNFQWAMGNWPLALTEPAEFALAKHLLNFGLTLEAVGDDCRPNFLCNYLYELATLYSRFYDHCPVLKAEEAVRATRLVLCELTSRVLKQGLDCLGIEAPEMM
jgi:arginyl-tRNA synthetase